MMVSLSQIFQILKVIKKLIKIEEMRRQEKRQGLVPFPRVGKSEGYNPRFWQHEKRSVPVSANSHAMWFGPRLGKRSPNEGDQF